MIFLYFKDEPLRSSQMEEVREHYGAGDAAEAFKTAARLRKSGNRLLLQVSILLQIIRLRYARRLL